MQNFGLDIIAAHHQADSFQLKMLANERAAAFFPVTTEHRDVRIGGLRYEDGYVGNAVAAMVPRQRIDFRYHDQFSATRIAAIVAALRPDLPPWMLTELVVTYHGKPISSA